MKSGSMGGGVPDPQPQPPLPGDAELFSKTLAVTLPGWGRTCRSEISPLAHLHPAGPIRPVPRGRDAVEGEGHQRRPQRRLERRLEVAQAVGGGYCRLQMPVKLALAVRETEAGRRGGGGAPPLPIFPCPWDNVMGLRFRNPVGPGLVMGTDHTPHGHTCTVCDGRGGVFGLWTPTVWHERVDPVLSDILWPWDALHPQGGGGGRLPGFGGAGPNPPPSLA